MRRSVGPGVEGGSASGPDGSSGLGDAQGGDVRTQGGDAEVQGDASRAADAADPNALNPVLLSVDATGNRGVQQGHGAQGAGGARVLEGCATRFQPRSLQHSSTQYYSPAYAERCRVLDQARPARPTARIRIRPIWRRSPRASCPAVSASKTWIALHHEPYHELNGSAVSGRCTALTRRRCARGECAAASFTRRIRFYPRRGDLRARLHLGNSRGRRLHWNRRVPGFDVERVIRRPSWMSSQPFTMYAEGQREAVSDRRSRREQQHGDRHTGARGSVARGAREPRPGRAGRHVLRGDAGAAFQT